MLSEISQTGKDKYCVFSLICGIYKIRQMKEYNKTERLNTESKLMVSRGERCGDKGIIGEGD